MKKLKRIISFMLVTVMVMTMSISVLAAGDDYTITIKNATCEQTYSAYKIFDVEYNEKTGAVTYTIGEQDVLYESIKALGVFTLTEMPGTDRYYVTANAVDSEIIAALQTIDIETLVKASATQTAEASGILVLDVGEPGYYYVTSGLGTVITIDTAHPGATVIDKNETVGGDKFYKYVKDSDGKWVQTGDAAMGDTLDFNVASNVPLYEGDNIVLRYVFTDTLMENSGMEIKVEPDEAMEHLTYDTDTKRWLADQYLIDQFVTLTDSNNKTYKLSDVAYGITLEFTDCTYDETAGYVAANGFILTFYTYDVENYSEGDPFTTSYPTDLSIDITYSVYVTDNAAHDEANTVELAYDTTKFSTPDPKEPVPAEKQYRTDHVLGWDLKILKVDGQDKTKYLEGAEFTLTGENLNHVKVSTTVTYTEIKEEEKEQGVTYYYLLANGRYTTTAPTDATVNEYDSEHPGPYVRTVVTDVVEDAGGTGTHTASGGTSDTGALVFDGLTAGTYTLTEIMAPNGYNLMESPIQIVIDWDSDNGKFIVNTLESSTLLADAAISDGELAITITNNAGSLLPSTGGMGTTIFYVIGVILVCGAAVLLVTRRRMNHEA